MINAITLSPGIGEHVYDTQIVYNAANQPINAHIAKNKSDALFSLDKMKTYFPNVTKVNLMVGWFGDTLDSGKIKIAPKVEHKRIYARDVWSVDNYKRESALQVSLDEKNRINWGGTPSDKSIINFVKELDTRGFEVMLSPIIYIDAPNKPWRGDIKASEGNDRDNFFSQYSTFIKHYASLNYQGVAIKDHIKAFSVGSDLKGLTASPEVVEKLIDLAKSVKDMLGNNIKITYSANWSEYHHDDLGNRAIDELWASPYIDMVGINAHFPITSENAENIDKLKSAWESGEHYDYYLADDVEMPLSPEWAVKNIEYWYKNEHYDANGDKTSWSANMKPIIFTEYGYSPVGRLAATQAKAIIATELFWREKSAELDNQGLGEVRYLHAWDLRPVYSELIEEVKELCASESSKPI
jgi:hypothetical protein